MDLLRKAMPLEVKDIDTKLGIFTGYFSSFGTVDSYREIVDFGAFKKTFLDSGPAAKRPRIKCAAQHDPFSGLLGKPLKLEEHTYGAYHETKVTPTSYGKDILLLIEDGVLTEQSFAFETIQDVAASKSPDGHRHLVEVKLWEYGPVTWGANENTPITGMKASDLVDRMSRLDKHLKNGDLSDGSLIALLTQTMELWGQTLAQVPAESEPKPQKPEVIELYSKPQTKEMGQMPASTPTEPMTQDEVDAEDLMAQCLKALGDCVAMAPKCFGSQEQTNALVSMLGQCVSLCVQCQTAMDEMDEMDGSADSGTSGISFEDTISSVYQAVRMIERIPYSDGVGDYARYWLAKTYEAYCVVEDGKTGKYLSTPWTMGADGVVLGDLVEVVMTWDPAAKAMYELRKAEMKAIERGQKAGARNSASDAATIREIHQRAQSLMDKPQQCKAMGEDMNDMTQDDMNMIMGLVDDTHKAYVLAAIQPVAEPGKSHSGTTTGPGGTPGPDPVHPDATGKSVSMLKRLLELEEEGA